MHIAMLSPIAWRTPPRHYGPWESVVSLLTEGLVSRGYKVTLFATGDSETSGKLHAVCARGYEEDRSIMPKVWECLHISELFEHAEEFDLIHNNFDFLPLTYSGLITTPVVTTIHGFSSPGILPVYKKYNSKVFYVSISDADRSPDLDYIKTIHHGIDIKQFDFQPEPDDYLLFFGRIHHDKGAREAIEIARACNKKLILAGIIQDEDYYHQHIEPHLDNDTAVYVGSAGPVQRNELLGKAYALLHPINFNEPFGLSVIESMACGTPVVAFSKGSMPELIENGKNGFLVNTVDEAISAIAHIKDIDRTCCRRRVEQHFTINRMVEEYIQVYETVLEKTNREDHRPWGYYKILADNDIYKSKETAVFPRNRLGLQGHLRRSDTMTHQCPIVKRYKKNPILTKDDVPYTVATVHNAGIVRHNGRYIMLFRSHRNNGRSIIGRADSDDGFSFTVHPEPFLTPATDSIFAEYEEFGVEDLRICPVEGDYLLTYSAYSRHGVRIALARTRDFEKVERIAFITQADLRNAVIFPVKFGGRYVRLDRPHSEISPWSIWISYSPDLVHWGDSRVIMKPVAYHWDEMKIGPGAPPFKTDKGWLHIYHGAFETMAGAVYRLGVALHNLNDPAEIIGVSDQWILQPEAPWEVCGYVPNVVFTCGAVPEDDGTVKIYWGGADTVMCAGTAHIDDLVKLCLTNTRSAL